MWFEAFWISTSILGAAFGTSLFLIYVLSSRIPTQEDLFGILATYGDAKIKEFGLAPGPGGRPPGQDGIWGMFERFLMTPTGQELAKKIFGGMTGGGGGMGGLLGP